MASQKEPVRRKAKAMGENKDNESSVLRPHQRNIQRNDAAPPKAQASAKKKQDLKVSRANEEAAVREIQALKAELEDRELRLVQSTADLKVSRANEEAAVQVNQALTAELEDRELRLAQSAARTVDLYVSYANDAAALARCREHITWLGNARKLSFANEAAAVQENHALKTELTRYKAHVAKYEKKIEWLNNQISHLKALLTSMGFRL
ncbi:hypothetical protein B0H11DRAFT_2088366 [Mycena galericulata]|nr:hypothetical protein B0H11DRAFT_2088366 [Mycena galericulata]